MFQIINIFGKKESILITEEEEEANTKISKQIDVIKGQLTLGWDFQMDPLSTISTSEPFGASLEHIVSNELHKRDVKLAKCILRIIGVFKNDTKSFLELYHICVSAFPGEEEELFFEVSLSLVYQGYKASNEIVLQFAEAYILETATDLTRTKIFCAQILINAKFNINEALNIYNANIQKLKMDKDEITNLS